MNVGKHKIHQCGGKEAKSMAQEDTLVMDGLDKGIVGITTDGNRIVYGYAELIDTLVDENGEDWEHSAAMDWIEYNIIRSLPYYGDKSPIIVETDGEDYEKWKVYHDNS